MARNALYPPSVKPGIPRLGLKPKGWTETTFGDVLHVIQRPAKIKDNVEYQLVTAKRGRGGIVPRETLTGKKILTKTQYFVAEDDFLISKRQIVHGACGIVPSTLDGALVSGEYSVLRVKDGLLLKYLDYFSHTDYFQMACFQASVGVDVEKMIFDLKEWLKVKIYLPPVHEQKKIVNILGTWDRSNSLTENLIFAKQKIKKGLLQQLLSGKKRFSEFSKNELPTVSLDTVCNIKSGIGFPEQEQGQKNLPIMFIKVSDMNSLGNEKYIHHSNNTVSLTTIKSLHATVFEEGTTVFPKVGAALLTNKRRLLKKPTAIDNNLMALEPTNVHPEFLYYWSLTLDLTKYVQPGAVPSVNKGDLSSIELKVPNLKEQRAIASVLTTIDLELDLLNQKLTAQRKQKKGLMQKLLTGQTRVKV